eukprot:GHRQ01021523.1.p3 GENE.GHRQ01021523.1~~GHRQ01021523.1.p3  ORF type:complete len:117 (+),score=33.64 GHRQ01021523.1:356-706(+)
MTMSLARLVLNKSILVGLRVVIRDEPADSPLEGTIQRYDDEQDCFILMDDNLGSQHAVQFHQFTVEEEKQQLVLKVTSCTHVVMAGASSTTARQSSTDAEGIPELKQHEACAADLE